MVAPAIALLNPYVLGAAAVGAGAVALGWVKREDADRLVQAALRESTALTLKAAPWLMATMTSARPQPLWRPDALPMADESAPAVPDIAPAPTTVPPAPAAPQDPKDPQDPKGWRGVCRRAIDRVTAPITGAMAFIRARWYLRWAPLPLALGYSVGRAAYTDYVQEEERHALQTPVPEKLRTLVKQSTPTLADALTVVHLYAHDEALMRELIPKMFRTAFTPDGALILVHALLETLSLHPAVGPELKREYLQLIEAEFGILSKKEGTLVGRFAEQMVMAKEDLETPDTLIPVKDAAITISGHVVRPGISNLLNDLRTEREAVLVMAHAHDRWVSDRGLPEATLTQTHARIAAIEKRLNLEWGVVQGKFRDPERYMSAVTEGFTIMAMDFRHKNRTVWEIMEEGGGDYDSPASIAGLLWGIAAFQSPGNFLTSLIFTGLGSKVADSNTAAEQSNLRRPIKFCLPDYGTNCDAL